MYSKNAGFLNACAFKSKWALDLRGLWGDCEGYPPANLTVSSVIRFVNSQVQFFTKHFTKARRKHTCL